MDQIKNILPSSLLRNRIKPQVEACSILDEFKKLVQNVWGSEVLKLVEPKYLKDGILYVNCTSSVASSALSLAKKKIIEELNQKSNSNIIKDIIFR